MSNIWNDFGLEDNPYDQRPLSIDKQGRKLFVGRSKELTEFQTIVSSPKGGIVVVEGGVGVGKTSFVNICQYDKWKKDNFLVSDKIELEDNLDITQFVLSAFSSIFHSLEKYDRSGRLNKYPIHNEARILISQTVQSSWGGNFQVLGTGGGANKQKTFTTPPAVVLSSILSTMNKWIDFVINKLNYKAVFVPINNLDIIEDEKILEFLNKVRDTLMGTIGIWWILIGKPGLFSLLEGKATRVSEMITGNPVVVKPLSKNEVHEMITLRIKNLTIDKKVKPPVDDKTINILYDASNGEARYILKRCGDLILKFHNKFPSEKVIPEKTANEMLMGMATERLEHAGISTSDRSILEKMVKKGRFQNKDFKYFGKSSPQNFNYTIKKFSELGFLIRDESKGKYVYYHTSGDINLVFHS